MLNLPRFKLKYQEFRLTTSKEILDKDNPTNGY